MKKKYSINNLNLGDCVSSKYTLEFTSKTSANITFGASKNNNMMWLSNHTSVIRTWQHQSIIPHYKRGRGGGGHR